MAKELPFFKFEISEWMFGRIQKQPESIRGMFIDLCCKYWHKLGEYLLEDAELDFGSDRIKQLMDVHIIGQESGYLFIKFLDAQLDECAEQSKKNSIKGLKSAKIRASRRQPQLTTVEPQLTTVEPNPTEEKRREEKRKENLSVVKIKPFDTTDYYNSPTEAFEDMKSDEKLIEDLTRLVHRAGYQSCTKVTVALAVKNFLTIESAKPDFDNRPKKEIKRHLVNWINKNAKTLHNGV